MPKKVAGDEFVLQNRLWEVPYVSAKTSTEEILHTRIFYTADLDEVKTSWHKETWKKRNLNRIII